MSRPPAALILADLRHRGARIRAAEDRLRLKAPAGVLSAQDRGTLAQHKAGVLERLDREEHLLNLSFSEFERSGCPIEIAVPGLSVSLWFVPQEKDAAALVGQGIGRGRIWTARELGDLLDAPGMTPEDAVSIARAKIAFSAEVVDVGPAEPATASSLPASGSEPKQARLDLDPTSQGFD